MNIVILTGRLTADPEVRYTSAGMAIATFSVAVNHSRKDKQTNEWIVETSFFNVKAFGSTAERIVKRYGKGDNVLISAELRQEKWETQDGAKRSAVVLIVGKIEDAAYKPKQDAGAQQSQAYGQPAYNQPTTPQDTNPQPQQRPTRDNPPPDMGPDDDIPF
ncbi:single-stranded DNA-binding protein [Nitratifractor sp.]